MKPEAREYQLKRLREMSSEEKLRAATRLYWSARRLKEAFFRDQHPDWTDEEVYQAAKEAFMYARD